MHTWFSRGKRHNKAASFRRYMCICHLGLHHKIFTLPNTIIMVILMWANAHLIHIPNHLGWGGVYYDENYFICWLDLRIWSYSFFYACVSVLLPIGFCFYAYCQIYLTIRSSKLSRNMIVNKKGESDVEKAARSAWQQEIMLVKTLFRIFVIFLLSWGPVAVLFCFNKSIYPPRWLNLLAILMAHGNSATNSLVYYFGNAALRPGTQKKRRNQTEGFSMKSRIPENTIHPVDTSIAKSEKWIGKLESWNAKRECGGTRRHETLRRQRWTKKNFTTSKNILVVHIVKVSIVDLLTAGCNILLTYCIFHHSQHYTVVQTSPSSSRCHTS